jgi:hypothetical protein
MRELVHRDWELVFWEATTLGSARFLVLLPLRSYKARVPLPNITLVLQVCPISITRYHDWSLPGIVLVPELISVHFIVHFPFSKSSSYFPAVSAVFANIRKYSQVFASIRKYFVQEGPGKSPTAA